MKSLLAVICITLVMTAFPVAAAPVTAGKPGLSPEEVRQRVGLIGSWLIETTTTEGGVHRILTRRGAEGDFEVTFVTERPDGRTDVNREVGYWGASGGIYFVLTFGWLEREGGFRPAGRRASGYYDDAYQIIRITHDTFEYQAIASGNRNTARRVADDYVLPGT
jgi:hypothetical protein